MSEAVIQEYLSYLERMRGFSVRTLGRQHWIRRFWTVFLLKKRKGLLEAAASDFLDFMESRSRTVKRKTVSKEVSALRGLYGYLFDFGKISKNPAAHLPELMSEPHPERSWLTVAECYKFLDLFDKSSILGLRNHTIAALLWSTGLRSSELRAVDWRDIDFAEGALRVRKGRRDIMAVTIALADFDRLRSEYGSLFLGALNHQPSGVAANERDLNLFSRYFHENGSNEITGEGILSFLAWLRHERENQAGSINRKECSIRSYLRFLRFSRVGGADRFPIESLPGARAPYGGPVEALEPREVIKLLCSIDRKSVLGFRDFLLHTMLYRLGLRIGEALAVNIKDIDFEKEIPHIHGKGRRKRKLPLLPEIMELIRAWLIYRANLCGADRLDALFVSKKGNRLSTRAARDNLQNLVAKAGPFSINKVTPHAPGHAFATHAIEGEQDIIVLKAIMGHARMSSTEIYLHPSIKTLKKAMNGHLASRILDGLIKDRRIPVRIHQVRDTT